MARVTDPFGNLLGVIENSHFSLEAMKLFMGGRRSNDGKAILADKIRTDCIFDR